MSNISVVMAHTYGPTMLYLYMRHEGCVTRSHDSFISSFLFEIPRCAAHSVPRRMGG